MSREFDARQTISRDTLQQIFPNLPGQKLNALLRSINSDLSAPLRVDASVSPNLTVSIGPAIVSNSTSNRQKTIPHIQGVIPAFVSGTVTFPASDGGTIVVSPGSNVTLNNPPNTYVKVLLSLNNLGDIVVLIGSADAVESNASVPPPNDNTLPFAYITIFNNAGTVQAVQQNKIYQFDRSFAQRPSSGGSSSSPWFAGNLPIGLGSDTVFYSFATPQPDTSYIVLPMLQNIVDANPQNLQILSIIKSTTGFTVKLNDVTDSSNYSVNYIVPLKAFHMAEVPVSNGSSSVSPVFGVPDNGSNYGLLAFLQNTTDVSPQFQPLVVTAKSSTGFTGSFNAFEDSANCQVVYFKMATAELILNSGITSKNISVPVAYGNSSYAVVAMMHNLTDANPQFQPLLVSAKSGNDFTISWQDPTDSANYKIVYYAISFA